MSCFLSENILEVNKCQIIFFGTPNFAVPSLETLNRAAFCSIKAVVTQPDKPVGRHHSALVPSPVKQAAQRLKIAVFDSLEALRVQIPHPEQSEGSLGIVVAYGEILPQWVLGKFPLGVLNIHPSLLPKYRGSSPIQGAILNQDKETGVSIIQLDNKMDHGPVLAQEVVKLSGQETSGELYDKLFQMGAELLIKILPDYIAGKIKPIPQDDSLATYTKKLTKEDGQIDWTKSPAEIEAQVRAMNPWPGAWTMWKGKRLIIWKTSQSGELQEVQLEGSRCMLIAEFLRGHPEFRNVKFQSSNAK